MFDFVDDSEEGDEFVHLGILSSKSSEFSKSLSHDFGSQFRVGESIFGCCVVVLARRIGFVSNGETHGDLFPLWCDNGDANSLKKSSRLFESMLFGSLGIVPFESVMQRT